jgi:hypothetical protein
MPIAKNLDTHQVMSDRSAEKENKKDSMEDENLLPTNDSIWPDLSGNNVGISDRNESASDSDEWENLSEENLDEITNELPGASTEIVNKKAFHRCASTPEFHSSLKDEDSYVLDCSTDSVDVQSLSTQDDAVLVSHKTSASMKKVPSFKDIIMLNAQKKEQEKQNTLDAITKHQQHMRETFMQRRRARASPKLVVNQIKRCAKSTGDLRSMVIHEDPEDGDFNCGGGGGGGTIHEDEVLGETDAMEFYNRKQKGNLNRQNGAKIRPDEAKRKEFIMHKKNAQRKAQQERQKGK